GGGQCPGQFVIASTYRCANFRSTHPYRIGLAPVNDLSPARRARNVRICRPSARKPDLRLGLGCVLDGLGVYHPAAASADGTKTAAGSGGISAGLWTLGTAVRCRNFISQ